MGVKVRSSNPDSPNTHFAAIFSFSLWVSQTRNLRWGSQSLIFCFKLQRFRDFRLHPVNRKGGGKRTLES